jgi:hypothetical protein
MACLRSTVAPGPQIFLPVRLGFPVWPSQLAAVAVLVIIERIVSKRITAPYRSGPSRDWQGEEPGEPASRGRVAWGISSGAAI